MQKFRNFFEFWPQKSIFQSPDGVSKVTKPAKKKKKLPNNKLIESLGPAAIR